MLIIKIKRFTHNQAESTTKHLTTKSRSFLKCLATWYTYNYYVYDARSMCGILTSWHGIVKEW